MQDTGAALLADGIADMFWCLMSVSLKVKTRKPNIKFTLPTKDRRFWQLTLTELATGLVQRTQKGIDAGRNRFKPYAPETKRARQKGYYRGRGALETSRVNLTATGKMLGAVLRGVRAKMNGGKIRLTGEEAKKAYHNERLGREFFGFDDKQTDNAFKRAVTWIRRKNNMR